MTSGLMLKDCYKTYTLDQDKAASPQQTVAQVKERLAKAGLDVLAETLRIDTGRLDIPVYISRCGQDALAIMPTKKQMGKGATPAQAEASAVMEMVERFSFFHFVHHYPFITATWEQVAAQAMPFEHIAAAVHHDPDDLDRARMALADLKLTWAPAFNLTRGREFLVPFSWFYEINEFNGPAAGNTLEEAIIQGLAEVVERHVSALVSRGRLDLPSIDPDSLESPVAQDLLRKFRDHDIQVFMKDFSLGLGLPTIGALAYDPATFPALSEIVYTAGTATDPEKALIRALTEVAQLGGDFITRANFVASGLPKYTNLAQADYITRPGPRVSIKDLPNPSHPNIKIEIESAVASLAKLGLEVYIINITHPVIGVPTIYTIIPGAHFRERAVGSSVPFFAAKMLTTTAEPEEAFDRLTQLQRLYPGSYFLKFFEGRTHLTLDQPTQAVEAFQSALDLSSPDEDLAAILTYLGLAFKEMEDYPRAIETLTRSAEVDDERRDTYNLLGFCYFKTKQHDKAIAAFDKVLQLDPGSGIDYANIGANYRALGQTAEAVYYFKTAIELDPSLTWARDILRNLEND